MSVHGAWQRFEESRNDRSFGKKTLRIRKERVDAFSCNADFRKKANDLLNWKANYTVEDAIVHAWNWEKKLAENA